MIDTDNPLIIDGHNDTLLNISSPKRGKNRSFFDRSDIGHLDLPRAIEGDFGGGFFACFVPPRARTGKSTDSKSKKKPRVVETAAVDQDYAQEVTNGMVDLLFQLEEESDGRLLVVRTTADLDHCLSLRILAAILHFEGAEAIDPGLENLELYYERGLRSLGLTWSRPNDFAYGVPFKFPASPDTGPGLTAAGQELVRECNRLGIMVDQSHLNEKGFWDVARISNSPLVATHSGVHEICQSTRNLTDDQLDAIGDTGGIVGINFHVGFLREDGKNNSDTPLSLIVSHALYVAGRIGIDHVALGSDFDGANMPAELGDVAGLPKLLDEFRAAGFDESDLRKIAHENWQRVLALTWQE